MLFYRRARGLALAAVIAAALPITPAVACTNIGQAPTTRWSLQRVDGVSWLVTPCGERFLTLGVNVLDGGENEHQTVGKRYSGYYWRNFAPTIGD